VAQATGILFVTDPIEDSFARGTLNVAGLEDVSFEARVPGPPITIRLNIGPANITVTIRFDSVARQFQGLLSRDDSDPNAAEWKKIVDLP
jgi:hypothetical protein